jgi:hypothetical protein
VERSATDDEGLVEADRRHALEAIPVLAEQLAADRQDSVVDGVPVTAELGGDL